MTVFLLPGMPPLHPSISSCLQLVFPKAHWDSLLRAASPDPSDWGWEPLLGAL